MQRLRTTLLSALLLTLTALALTACSGGPTSTSSVTRFRLERSLEHSFAHRYIATSKLLGHPGVTVKTLQAHAVCDKGGPSVPDVGPGGDWICQVAYQDINVPNPDGSGKVELNVHSNNCYTAAGPSKLVGPLNIVDTKGRNVVNPAFEFDACFDPGANSSPNGTLLIANATPLPGAAPVAKSALTLPVGLVTADNARRIPLMLACADGAHPCQGSIDVNLMGKIAKTVSYDVKAGATMPVNVALTSRQVHDGGLITLITHETSPPPAPIAS